MLTDNSLNAGGPNYATQIIFLSGVGTGVPAALTSPAPGRTLAGSSVTFTRTAGTAVTQYKLWLGTTAGSANLYSSGATSATTVTVSGLPTSGATLYGQLLSLINGAWQSNSYTYTEELIATPAVLTTPKPGSTLAGSSMTFTWTAGAGVTQYKLWLGTSGPGSSNLYSSGSTLATSATVTNLPTRAATIYVRLFSVIRGVTQYNDYRYTEQ